MKKMIYELTHHLFHYFILLIIVTGGLFAFFSFQSHPMIQLMVSGITALSYVLWGIVHHFLDHDLNAKIIIEYLAISVFAIVILWNVLI